MSGLVEVGEIYLWLSLLCWGEIGEGGGRLALISLDLSGWGRKVGGGAQDILVRWSKNFLIGPQ